MPAHATASTKRPYPKKDEEQPWRAAISLPGTSGYLASKPHGYQEPEELLEELLLDELELELEPELPLVATCVRGWMTAPRPWAKAVAVRRRPVSALPGVASAVVRPSISPGA